MLTKINGTATAVLFTASLLLIGAPVSWVLYSQFQSNERHLQARAFSVLYEMSTHLENKFGAVSGLFKHLGSSGGEITVSAETTATGTVADRQAVEKKGFINRAKKFYGHEIDRWLDADSANIIKYKSTPTKLLSKFSKKNKESTVVACGASINGASMNRIRKSSSEILNIIDNYLSDQDIHNVKSSLRIWLDKSQFSNEKFWCNLPLTRSKWNEAYNSIERFNESLQTAILEKTNAIHGLQDMHYEKDIIDRRLRRNSLLHGITLTDATNNESAKQSGEQCESNNRELYFTINSGMNEIRISNHCNLRSFLIDSTKIFNNGPSISPFDLMVLTTPQGEIIGSVASDSADSGASTLFRGTQLANIKQLVIEAKRRADKKTGCENCSFENGENGGSSNEALSLEHLQTFEVNIGGLDYQLFASPFKFPKQISQATQGSPSHLLLVGLIPKSEAQSSKYTLSPSYAALTVAIVCILLAVWPIVRMRFMGMNQSLKPYEFRFAIAGIALLLTTLTIVAIDLTSYASVKSQIKLQVKHINQQVKNAVVHELNTKKQLAIRLVDEVFSHSANTQGDSEPTPAANEFSHYLDCANRARTVKLDTISIDCWRTHPFEGEKIIDHLFLLDERGKQIGPFFTWYDFTVTKSFSVPNREYYSRLIESRGWSDDSDIPFFQQHSLSYSDGMESTFTSLDIRNHKDCTPADAEAPRNSLCEKSAIAVIEYNIKSLISPILPYGYRLALIDNNNGNVLYHSEGSRNLLENFLIATDHSTAVKLALSNSQNTSLRINYNGIPHFASFNNLASEGVPWTVVVLYEHSNLQALNFNAVVITFVSMMLMLLIYAFLLLLSKPFTPGFSWIWPSFERAGLYPCMIALAVGSCVQAGLFGYFISDSPVLFGVLILFLLMANWAFAAASIAHAPQFYPRLKYALYFLFALSVSISLLITVFTQTDDRFAAIISIVLYLLPIAYLLVFVIFKTKIPYLSLLRCRLSHRLARLHPVYFTFMIFLAIVIPSSVFFKQAFVVQSTLFTDVAYGEVSNRIKKHMNSLFTRYSALYPQCSNYPEVCLKNNIPRSIGDVKHNWLSNLNSKTNCPNNLYGFSCTHFRECKPIENIAKGLQSKDSKTAECANFLLKFPAGADAHPKNNQRQTAPDNSLFTYISTKVRTPSDFGSKISFAAENLFPAKGAIAYTDAKTLSPPLYLADNGATYLQLRLLSIVKIVIHWWWLLAIMAIALGWITLSLVRGLAYRYLGLHLTRPIPQDLPDTLLEDLKERSKQRRQKLLVVHPGKKQLEHLIEESQSDHSVVWQDLSKDLNELKNTLLEQAKLSDKAPFMWVFCYNLELAIQEDNSEAVLDFLSSVWLQKNNVGLVVWCERSPLYRLLKAQAYCEESQSENGNKHLPRWINLFSQMRKFYAGTRPIDIEFELSDQHTERLIQLSMLESAAWPDLFEVHQDFKAWLESKGEQYHYINHEDLATWYVSNAGAIYRRKWELCTRAEKIALYQLASGGFLNCHNAEVIEHLERGGYVVRDPRLRIQSLSFQKFVLAAETPESFNKWMESVSHSSWDLIRIPLFTLIFITIAAVTYLFNTEMESLLAAMAAIPAVITLLIKGIAFVKGAPVND